MVSQMKNVDIEKEKKILRKIHRKMALDHTTDVEEEMSYIAEDAFLIPPNGPVVVGADIIRELVKEMVKTEVISKSGGPTRIDVASSGDLAYDLGNYRIVNKGEEGPIVEEGNFVTIYKKINDQWKFMGQVWNNIAE
jgi:ketosteroid isomerase-like protein